MTELENIKSLEKYDAWKKAKRKRKNGISLIAGLIGGLIGFLLTWAILRVGFGDLWNLGKGAFSSESKIMEIVPKIEEVDNKLKKSIVAKPMNWISKKYEEQVAQEVSKGNLGAIASGIRVYCFILIFVWLVVWFILFLIPAGLTSWVIGKYWWPEPDLSSQEIDI